MSLVCDICGRGTVKANSVSFSKRRVKKDQKINLQSRKINGKRIKICSQCLKTQAKSK